jgi:hypothetical protein
MIAAWLVLALLQTQTGLPVLDFPEPGLDDTASYQGYKTRFYRDSEQNTVQIYMEPRSGRIVNLWANGANESIGLTVRDARGRAVPLAWKSDTAGVGLTEITWVPGLAPKNFSPWHKSIEYHFTSDRPQLQIGSFILGSMRIERDYQYSKRHLRPFSPAAFVVAEESLLVARVERLPGVERRRALELLRADNLAELKSRLRPMIVRPGGDTAVTLRILRQSLDGRNYLMLDLRVDSAEATARVSGKTIVIRSRTRHPVSFKARFSTDALSLTPLKRGEIFNQSFLAFLAQAGRATDSAGIERYRRLERQVRAVELLSSKEKLMAGLPNFATYFGRDMMMSALMMRPIWSPAMSEHVIASVLRKLGPNGDVSHEEALGGQAIRENAVVYDSLIRRGRLQEAREVLANLQKTRENYHMIDDEFQLPVLVAGYLADTSITAEQKRAFLVDSSDGRGPRLALLLRELALVSAWTARYVRDPRATNLVSFPKRDATHWRSASWRDSDAGYAGGRFAMDVNAMWAPHALQSTAVILSSLNSLGFGSERLNGFMPGLDTTSLGEYRRSSASLDRALRVWRGARRHFEVKLPPSAVRARVNAKLASLPGVERRYWQRIVGENRTATTDSLFLLALSLDTDGKPIPVVNTDPATGLFLDGLFPDSLHTTPEQLERDLSTFALPYPVGLLMDSLGPVVANDAYASPQIWRRFREDLYHSPRVVWGREVNLISLGLSQARGKVPADWLTRILAAVEASGLGHNELWSYRIEGDRLLPMRYGTSSDVQLWNTTDLAVEFELWRLQKQSR